MIYDVPEQYASELMGRYTTLQSAKRTGRQSLIDLCQRALNQTLDKCSDALGLPRDPKPDIIFVDEVMKLEYPVAP